jgi:uncharacterized protein (DUF2384 family)
MAGRREVIGQTQGTTHAPTSLSYEAYSKLVSRAVEVFGSEEAANHWLTTPQPKFDNQIPLRMAELDGFSLARFEEYFARVEHGIYS